MILHFFSFIVYIKKSEKSWLSEKNAQFYTINIYQKHEIKEVGSKNSKNNKKDSENSKKVANIKKNRFLFAYLIIFYYFCTD